MTNLTRITGIMPNSGRSDSRQTSLIEVAYWSIFDRRAALIMVSLTPDAVDEGVSQHPQMPLSGMALVPTVGMGGPFGVLDTD
jgi:hypothetical protein